MSRATRRRQKFRMKSRARKIASEIWGNSGLPEVVKNLVKNCDNLKKCSCEVCRNPRRSKWAKRADKLTRQEKIAELSLREQVS